MAKSKNNKMSLGRPWGARCEEALSGTALRGKVVSILKFYSGNGGAKFSKKICSCLKDSRIG